MRSCAGDSVHRLPLGGGGNDPHTREHHADNVQATHVQTRQGGRRARGGLARRALARVRGAIAGRGRAPAVTAAIGMGSDTTQFVLNAYAGFNQGTGPNNYLPIQSSAATGSRQVISFNALDPSGAGGQCIVPKPGAPGPLPSVRVLAGPACAEPGQWWQRRRLHVPPRRVAATEDYGGYIDFARSSSGPASGDAGTDLTYIPRVATRWRSRTTGGRLAGHRSDHGSAHEPLPDGRAADHRRRADLRLRHPARLGHVQLVADHGLRQHRREREHRDERVQQRRQQRRPDRWTSRGEQPCSPQDEGRRGRGSTPGAEVVIGFSASNWVALQNGVTVPSGGGVTPPASQVGVGAIDGNSATTGTGPYTGSTSFYANTTYGRDVYIVLPTAIITGLGNNDLKTLFVGPSAAICRPRR